MPERKQVLLIDAVTWSPAYPASSPLRDVGAWFRRHLADSDTDLRVLDAEGDLLSALQNGVRGVIISGSPRDAWTDDPVNGRLCEVIRACRDRELPVLGVCYGHQILGRALGGVVAPHPRGFELGNTTVELTPAGEASPLFHGVPKQVDVLSSHRDAVLQLPPGCELLAKGDFTPIQAFHWQGRLLGVQFHPEHDPESLRFLWSVRRERWRGKVAFDLDRALDDMQPTPFGAKMLRNFVERIAR
jgi:GMP synthase (glutamine-hydrolysing)